MKLYELPAGAKFKIVGEDETLYKFFNQVNFSTWCENADGEAVTDIPPFVDVEIVQ